MQGARPRVLSKCAVIRSLHTSPSAASHTADCSCLSSLLLPPPLLLLLLLLLLPMQVDSDRCRILPDGSRWVVDLWGAAADMALGSKPYSWKKGMARKGGSSFKWLIPVVAYGQVS
jgi:hypothetical protein